MNKLLWVLQVLLAVAFLAHGWLFLSPPPQIAVQMNAFLPWLITWAAGGIMIVTASATVFHLVRGEISSAVVTFVLLAMAAFVAYMRHRILPIGARSTT